MSGFLDDLEARLRASASELHGAAPAPAPRRRRWSRPRLLALVAVVGLAGAAVPAVSTMTDVWEPDVEPQAPWGHVEERRRVDGERLSCRDRGRRRAARPIGPEFARAFSVFARPQRPSDRIERRYLQVHHGADPRGVRRLGVAADRRAVFLVPGYGIGPPPPSEACLRRMSAKQRATWLSRPDDEPYLCVLERGGGGCGRLRDIVRIGTYGASGTVRGQTLVTGVAPDGVVEVVVTYGRSTREFPVSGNFFSFRLGIDVEQASRPDRLRWRMADGTVRDVTR